MELLCRGFSFCSFPILCGPDQAGVSPVRVISQFDQVILEVDGYKTVGPCANLKLTKDEGEYPFTELFHFLLSFDRITPLGYNCDPSMKTPAENTLFGVLIIYFFGV